MGNLIRTESFDARGRTRAVLLRNVPAAAAWLFALAIGVQVAQIGYELIGPRQAAPRSRYVELAAPPASQPGDGIANAHLFGIATGAAEPQSAAGELKGITPIRVSGIIAASDPRKGLAILASDDQASRLYAVGDRIPGGAILHSVYRRSINVDLGGRLTQIPLWRYIRFDVAPDRLDASEQPAELAESPGGSEDGGATEKEPELRPIPAPPIPASAEISSAASGASQPRRSFGTG
jgi:hypothetical protein